MKRAVVFSNGNLSDLPSMRKNIQPDDFIICADGGAKYAVYLNLIPHVIIGDFDSFPDSLKEKLTNHHIDWIKYKREKDQTDTELAIDYAVKKEYKNILLLGIMGNRLDHLITNILSLIPMAKKGIQVTIIDRRQEAKIVTRRACIRGNIGDQVSLIPLADNAEKVTTIGLKYKLRNENLYLGYSRGISNIMTNNTAEISIQKGTLLLIHYKLSLNV